MMIISKTTMNIVRNGLENTIKQNEENLAIVIDNIKKLALANISCNSTIRCIAQKKVMSELGITLPTDVSFRDLEEVLIRTKEQIRLENLKIKSILKSFSREGLTDITYSLPFFILSHYGADLGYSYLLVSGIKKNAQSKTLDGELMDELEMRLLDCEIKLAKYIDDDLSIDTNFITEFIKELTEYLLIFYSEKGHMYETEGFDFNRALDTILINMAIYIIYCKTGHELNDQEANLLNQIYIRALYSNFTVGGAIRIACQKIIDIVETKKQTTSSSLESQSEVMTIEEKHFEAYDYIEDGVVVKVCNLKRFKELLDETDLKDSKKQEFIAQMSNLKNRIAQEEFTRRMKELRERLLTPRELHLYELAWSNEETSKDAKYIDDIIEMMLDASDEEMALLMEELFPAFSHLSEVFEAKKAEDVPKVMFLTETIQSEAGNIEKPKILSSLSKILKGDLKQISISMKKLFQGVNSTIGDREYKGTNLPCRIWYKGKDYKVFYTVIGDVVVILDVFKGSDAFQRMANLASKTDFVKRLATIREYLVEGNMPNEKAYIDLINNELEGTKTFIKNSKIY